MSSGISRGLPVTALVWFLCDSAVRAAGGSDPAPTTRMPELLGAQYTFVLQHQGVLRSPYQGPLSLDSAGDTQPSHTIGLYVGWAATNWAQIYLDTEKFMGAGVSRATGLGGLTNGDVVREGAAGLKKEFYIARSYLRLMLPLSSTMVRVERAQDQTPGTEAATRLELKFGRLAASDDFDRNRYAGSTRTEFMNWSLWDNTSWDYAANTRGYTDGLIVGFVSSDWSLKYGIYRMPKMANGQTLESSIQLARGQNFELTLSPRSIGTIVRVLAYRNIASMGDYAEALRIAAGSDSIPEIMTDDRPGRRKSGVGINAEQPLADDGETGMFLRWGRNDGNAESFAFTEVDQHLSAGGQLSGAHWNRGDDRLGIAVVSEGLSRPHREYIEAGGSGFLLGDGALNYGREEIIEAYYRLQFTTTSVSWPLLLQWTPDFQYIRNPGFNRDRGPARFWALRLHAEF